jgi:hypothetical protein
MVGAAVGESFQSLVFRVLLACVLTGAGWAAGSRASAAIGDDLRLSGVVEVEAALGIRHASAQKAEAVFEPELEWRAPGGLRVRGIGRLRLDAFDRIEPGHPKPTETSSLNRRHFIGDPVDYELRELVVEGRWRGSYLTLGKQQVVWGEADGLKVLDVVNPQSFREFILDDFEDSRIPLWTVNVEVPIRGSVLQLLWIPDPSFHELPEDDAVFALSSPRVIPPLPPGVPVELEDLNRPRRLLADSDAGARLSGSAAGVDWSVNYLYHYDDRPVFFSEVRESGGAPLIRVSPGYERTHLLGGTLSSAFGNLTVRGELGYSTDRWLSTDLRGDRDGVVDTGELGYVLGLDWFGFRDTMLSFQLFQSWLTDDPSGVVRDELDTNLSLLLRRDLWNERLQLEAIWIHNLNDADGLIRPRITLEVASGWSAWLGVDVFYGRSAGLFGQYDHRDRVVAGMKWGF